GVHACHLPIFKKEYSTDFFGQSTQILKKFGWLYPWISTLNRLYKHSSDRIPMLTDKFERIRIVVNQHILIGNCSHWSTRRDWFGNWNPINFFNAHPHYRI